MNKPVGLIVDGAKGFATPRLENDWKTSTKDPRKSLDLRGGFCAKADTSVCLSLVAKWSASEIESCFT